MIKKILIVDDSPIARKILKSCLPKDQGFDFYEAVDGLVGFEKFKSVQPDIVFMDITMPVMDGMQCLEEIKKIHRNAVVIMCTADVQAQSYERAMGLGAIAMIKKPASKDSVEKALLKAQIEVMKNKHFDHVDL